MSTVCGARYDEHFHVGLDLSGTWWAVLGFNSYGGSHDRAKAIEIAVDAKVSTKRKHQIIVHKPNGTVDFRITRCRTKPSSQFFQDSVP